MIQPLNSISANCCGTTRKQSFGDKAPSEFCDYRPEDYKNKKPSKAKMLATYTATQFAAGAVVSGVFDGMANLWRAAFKNKPLMSLKEVGGRAAFVGSAFVVIGLVFNAIGAALARKDK